eukprot:TRINITY_DN103139_c0_g1_i1.p1 TRINITY_DN103139_c0_g1~~TRINITY_DN103139_c0_g1_i1.p1  ORF type:complete len:1298 (-),score=178.68 TRINITY_DN103139_c0_g1_i1:43-3936(-)
MISRPRMAIHLLATACLFITTEASDAELLFEAVDGGFDRACRGPNLTDSPSYYAHFAGVHSIEQCKDLCRSFRNRCRGIEYGSSLSRCEVWVLEGGIAWSHHVLGYTCLRAEHDMTLNASATANLANTSSVVSVTNATRMLAGTMTYTTSSSSSQTTVEAVLRPTTTTSMTNATRTVTVSTTRIVMTSTMGTTSMGASTASIPQRCQCVTCHGAAGPWQTGTCPAGASAEAYLCKNDATAGGCYSSLDEYACLCPGTVDFTSILSKKMSAITVNLTASSTATTMSSTSSFRVTTGSQTWTSLKSSKLISTTLRGSTPSSTAIATSISNTTSSSTTGSMRVSSSRITIYTTTLTTQSTTMTSSSTITASVGKSTAGSTLSTTAIRSTSSSNSFRINSSAWRANANDSSSSTSVVTSSTTTNSSITSIAKAMLLGSGAAISSSTVTSIATSSLNIAVTSNIFAASSRTGTNMSTSGTTTTATNAASDSLTTSELASGRSDNAAGGVTDKLGDANLKLQLANTSAPMESVTTLTTTEAALKIIGGEPEPDRTADSSITGSALATANISSMPYPSFTSTKSGPTSLTSTSIPVADAAQAAPGGLAELEVREQAILDIVLSGATGGEASLRNSDGVKIVARELTAEAMSGAGALELAAEGGIMVRVPASFLEAVDGHGLLVVSPVMGLGEEFPHTDKGLGVEGVVSIRAASMVAGTWVSVQDLDEPIQFSLRVNSSNEVFCAFWDEQRRSWSDKGVETLGRDAHGSLQCSSTHLTLFGAVAGGFVRALLCSQASLLSKDGLVAIGRGDWAMRVDAALLWLVLMLEGGLLLIAVVLDMRRSRELQWTDEHFLTCNSDVLQGSASCSQFSKGGSALFGRSRASLTQGVGNGCCQSSKETLMNFIDFLGSGLHAYFSQLRNFGALTCESLSEFCMAPEGQPGRAVDRLLVALLAVSIKYQACAALWMSHEDLSFIQEERKSQLADRDGSAAAAIKRASTAYPSVHASTTAWQDNFGKTATTALCHMSTMHQAVGTGLQQQHLRLMEQKCVCFPIMAWRLFRSQAPWLTVLHYSIFMPASLGTLLLITRTSGALAVTALFFQTSGAAISADSSARCKVAETVWESLGECVAVGLVTVFLAAVPELLLSKLHNREFLYFEAEDDPERLMQLRIWWRKDMCLCILCTVYIAFCLLFVMSFLANVTALDGITWQVSALIEVVAEFLLVPMVTSTFFWLVTNVAVRRKNIVKQSGEDIGCLTSDIEAQAHSLPGLLMAMEGAQSTLKQSKSNPAILKINSIRSDGSNFIQ